MKIKLVSVPPTNGRVRKIQAIKELCSVKDLGLREAKNIVDAVVGKKVEDPHREYRTYPLDEEYAGGEPQVLEIDTDDDFVYVQGKLAHFVIEQVHDARTEFIQRLEQLPRNLTVADVLDMLYAAE